MNLLGSGTAWVIAQAPDSSVQIWLARAGALHVARSSYGTAATADLDDGFSITRSRGTIAGDYHVTAKLVPDSATTVTAGQDFSAGISGVRLQITGTGP